MWVPDRVPRTWEGWLLRMSLPGPKCSSSSRDGTELSESEGMRGLLAHEGRMVNSNLGGLVSERWERGDHEVSHLEPVNRGITRIRWAVFDYPLFDKPVECCEDAFFIMNPGVDD